MFLISKPLSTVDAFGQQVKFSIGKSESVSTWFGGLLTLIALTATALLAANTIADYIYHTNPSTSFEYDYLPDPGFLDLNSSNFLFSITDQDSDYLLSSAIVSFNLYYVVQTRFEDGSFTREKHAVPLVRCTREYWAGFESDYDLQNMDNRLCPSISQYNITGTFLSTEYVYLQLEVEKCKNRTDQPDIICKPQDELDSILPGKDIAISFMYTDNIFNLNDWRTPVKRFVTNLHWDIAPEVLSKKADVFVSDYNIVTDDNILLNGYWQSEISTYQINGVSRDQNFAPEASDIYMKIYLRKSSSSTTATRQFLKLGDLLESLGGLSGFWFAILGVLAIWYNKKVFDVKMANSLYEFDKNYDKPSKRRDRKGKIAKNSKGPAASKNHSEDSVKKGGFCNCLKNICNCLKKCLRSITCRKANSKKIDDSANGHTEMIQSPKIEAPSTTEHNRPKAADKVKLYLKHFQNYSKGVGKKMTYNFWDFIVGILTCGRRKKDKLISLAAERIQEDTDITQILKRIQDLEKFKVLFFNEHQRRIFSHSRPPLISLEEPAEPEENIPKISTPQQEKQKKGSKQNFIKKLKMRRKNLFSGKDPLEDVDTISKFALIYESYRKVRRVKSKFNRDLLRLLDPYMEKTLYNLDFELKIDETFDKEYFKIVAMRALEDLLIRTKRKRAMIGKVDAADIIARKWLMLSKRRKAREVERVNRMKTLTEPELMQIPQETESAEPLNKERMLTINKDTKEDDNISEYELEEPDVSGEEEDDDEIYIPNYAEEIKELQSPMKSPDGIIEANPASGLKNGEDSRLEINTRRMNGKDAVLSLIEKKNSRFFT